MMLKAILYLGLAAAGVIVTLVTPFAGVIACIEAYLMNPAALALTDGGLRYQFLAMLVLLVSWIAHRPESLRPVGGEVWIMRLLWTFVAIGFLSSLWAVANSSAAVDSMYEVFKTVLLVGVMVRVISTERHMSMVVTALIVGAWHAAFLHVFGVRWGYVDSALGKGIGVLSDPQAGVMVLFVPLLILSTMFGTRTQKILALCALPFVLDSIVESYERTALVGVGLECGLLLIYLPKRISVRLLPLIAAAAALFIFRLTPPDYWDKMATILTPHDEASANSRFTVNDASVQMFLEHPFGVGYGNYKYVSPRYLPDEVLTSDGGRRLRSPHNSFAEILCDTGVEGFVPWIATFAVAVVVLRKVRRRTGPDGISRVQVYAMAFELGLFGWMMGGLTQDYQEVDPAYWFVGFAVVLARLHYQSVANAAEELSEPEDLAVVTS